MLVSAIGGGVLALKIFAGTELSETLLHRKIQESFTEKISRIRATQGDILELAVLETTTTFEISDDWQSVPASLGKTVSRVSVPAVFRFFSKISEPISLKTENRDGTIFCTISVPPPRPILPVAFDSAQMSWNHDVGIFRFNKDEQRDFLQKKISLRLALQARNHAKTAIVRDAARKAFEKFAEKWMREIRELRERPETKISVRVVFSDEIPPSEKPDAENAAKIPETVPVTL